MMLGSRGSGPWGSTYGTPPFAQTDDPRAPGNQLPVDPLTGRPIALPRTSVFASPVDQSTPKPSPLAPARSVWEQFDPAGASGQGGVELTPQLPMADMPDVKLDMTGARSVNVWDRVKDYLHSPGVAAALFRGGAETLQNGFGSGLSAAAGSMDQTRAREAEAQQQQFMNFLAQGKLAVDQQHEQAARDKVNYQVVPEGGTMIGMRADGSLLDPAAAAPFVGGGGRPSQAPPASSGAPSAAPQVTSAGDYARLPPGARYVNPQGRVKIKGGAPSQGGARFP